MDKYDKKRSFKTKVIAKLFGQADEDEYIPAVSSDFDEGDDIDTLENSQQLRSPHTKVYGAECCPTEQRQENSDTINGCEREIASCVSASDDEDSECFEVRRKHKRRRRHDHFQDKRHQPPSTNGSSQTNENACHLNDLSSLTVPSLSKNKKRKLKKKQKKREKTTQNSPSMEFTFVSYSLGVGIV